MSVSTGREARALEHGHLLPFTALVRRARTVVVPRNGLAWLVLGGRAILIWLPVYALMAPTLTPLRAVLTASAVSAIWLLALRAALSAYFTLGPAVASAV